MGDLLVDVHLQIRYPNDFVRSFGFALPDCHFAAMNFRGDSGNFGPHTDVSHLAT